ncbi:MAG: hypothetical protein QM831_24345 [Kofleriaceae bacterium]
MKLLALVAIAACGGSSPPAPIANKPKRADVTCDDAAVILRGPVQSSDKEAGPAKEAAIKRACVDAKWDAKVLDCIGSYANAAGCTVNMTEQQRDDLAAKLDVWQGQYPLPTDDDGPDDSPADAGNTLRCEDMASYSAPLVEPQPIVDDVWQRPKRQKVLEQVCLDESWSNELRGCVLGDDRDKCLADQSPLTVKRLADLNDMAKKIVAAKQKPASITCAAAAAEHYSDKRSKAKKLAAKDIKASRAEMQRVCTAEVWDDDARACIVAADDHTCYKQPTRWAYPAMIVAGATVPANCALYKVAVQRWVACDKYPAESRKAMDDAFKSVEQTWQNPNMSPDDQKIWNDACDAGFEAIATISGGCDEW